MTSPETVERIHLEVKSFQEYKQEQVLKANDRKEEPPVIEENQKVFIIPNIRSKKSPRAVENVANSVKERTFKINNDVKRNKGKIKRIKKNP